MIANPLTRDMRAGRSLLLGATSMSYVLVILDSSIVNVALPSIGSSIGVAISGLEWIVNAYLVVFASFLLSGGSLCDRFGASRVYIAGLALFVGASLLCGAGGSFGVVLAGRVLQGYGAALLVPSALALIIQAYTDQTERSRAIATWASWGGLAMVLGPLTGGVLIQAFGWRSIFLINVPIGLAGIALTARARSSAIGGGDAAGERGSHRFDVVGQITANVAAVALIASLIEAPVLGWTSTAVLCGLGLFAVSAAAFVLAEAVLAEAPDRAPMLPLGLFRDRNFSAISYMFFTGTLAFFGVLFVLSFYFQRHSGFSALETGLGLFPLSCCVVLGNRIAGRLAARLTPRTLMLIGECLKLPGFGGLLLVRVDPGYAVLVAPLCLIGLGGGLAAPMYTSLFMAGVKANFTGIASGVSRATGQIGSAMGVALFGALIADELRFLQGMTIAVSAAVALTVSIVLMIHLVVRDVPSRAAARADGSVRSLSPGDAARGSRV